MEFDQAMTDFSKIQIRPAIHSDMDSLVTLLKELFAIEDDFEFDEPLQRKGLAMVLSDTEKRCVLVAKLSWTRTDLICLSKKYP